MTDNLASSLRHVASTAADAGESCTQWIEGAAKSSSAQQSVDEAPVEAAGSLIALEELQEQLTALRAECIKAQQLKDHWHSEYTAQVSPSCYLHSAPNAMHVYMSRLSALHGNSRCLGISAALGKLSISQ